MIASLLALLLAPAFHTLAYAEEIPSVSVTQPTPSASPVPAPAPAEPVSSDKWSGGAGAFILGATPLFTPAYASSDRLNMGNVLALDLGAELKGAGLIELRYAHGSIPSLSTYDQAAFVTTQTPNAPFTLYSLIAGGWIPLNAPYGKLGAFQFFIPLQMGTTLAKIAGPSVTFMGLDLDLAAGLGVHYYTHTTARLDLLVLYRGAFPLGDFTASDTSLAVVQDAYGETMKLSTAGFEVRIGVSFLLPEVTP